MNQNLINKIGTYAILGTTAFAATIGIGYLYNRTNLNNPTNIYYTEIDGNKFTKQTNEDLFMGYEDKTLEAWVRNEEGKLIPYKQISESSQTELESQKTDKLSQIDSTYEEYIQTIKESFEGLRKKLAE